MHANQTAYLSRAVEWAKIHGLKVIVCLHGLPMSQNGRANSGRAGFMKWQDHRTNANRAEGIVAEIGTMFSHHRDTVTHIELANEPFLEDDYHNNQQFTRNYYKSAASRLTNYSVVIHDGFLPLSDWYIFTIGKESRLVVDTHVYQGLFPYGGAGGKYEVVHCCHHHVQLTLYALFLMIVNKVATTRVTRTFLILLYANSVS